MPLMTTADVKDRFEKWSTFCTVKDSEKTPEEILDLMITDAEAELLRFLDVDETTITDYQKVLLMHLIRYHCFMIRHGDTTFEKNEPQIIKKYEMAIKVLKKSQTLSVTAKDRMFKEWFTGE